MKVSVIIPTYNRLKSLICALESIKTQDYDNFEIIVINDYSNEQDYYTYDWQNINIIHLDETNCSRNKIGYPCVGYVRNIGIEKATGDYIAFCDDDDCWLPNKLKIQIGALKQNPNCKMISSDGLIGNGIYDKNKEYKKYNKEHYFIILQNIYKNKNSNLLDNGFPDIFNLEFLRIHNCMITSSVIIEKILLNKIGNMEHSKIGEEDYGCWLKALKFTDSIYLKDEVLFYYDNGHCYGRNY
jgi:glycosyltransferase involved in cell wall biosynthesis